MSSVCICRSLESSQDNEAPGVSKTCFDRCRLCSSPKTVYLASTLWRRPPATSTSHFSPPSSQTPRVAHADESDGVTAASALHLTPGKTSNRSMETTEEPGGRWLQRQGQTEWDHVAVVNFVSGSVLSLVSHEGTMMRFERQTISPSIGAQLLVFASTVQLNTETKPWRCLCGRLPGSYCQTRNKLFPTLTCYK